MSCLIAINRKIETIEPINTKYISNCGLIIAEAIEHFEKMLKRKKGYKNILLNQNPVIID